MQNGFPQIPMNKRLVVIGVIALVAVGLIAVTKVTVPAYPSVWEDISIGMKRENFEDVINHHGLRSIDGESERYKIIEIRKTSGVFLIKSAFHKGYLVNSHCKFDSNLGEFFSRGRNK